ncbi:MAG: HD domain-containing protein [Candidatus Verstraetearchaeota archaeon]|nr:HD domain-containing protein [Candidatus Verstraetearchaeota archaeon]
MSDQNGNGNSRRATTPISLSLPYQENQKLRRVAERIEKDERLRGIWKCSNVMAIERLGYTDHGATHVKIVANSALKILRILSKSGVVPSIVKDYSMEEDDAEVVVVLGALFHDAGMIVTRTDHELFGIAVAYSEIGRILEGVYPPYEVTVMLSEVMHTIVSHEEPHKPLSIEAGVVKVADALDMEKGRARLPFEAGRVDIHSVSALSIEKVRIQEGTGAEKPVVIRITMSNSAGIFQIDELLKPRIESSGLQKYIHVVAEVVGPEKKILEKFEF